jgi:hypothetical protein
MTTAEVLKTPRLIRRVHVLNYGSNTLTVNHTKPQRQADAMDTRDHLPCPESPVAAALRSCESFTRDQVAWLMAEAMRWGYERRVDEENDAWPPDAYFIAGELFRDLDRKAYRDAHDAAALLPRPGDFKGTQAEAPALRVVA